jgi:thiopeptide-type bacteriocin biosynthesis protein
MEPSGFFVLRSPLLPFDSFLEWSSSDPAKLRSGLRDWLAQAEIREAIFLASPSLEESLEHWEKDPTSERGAKVEQALVKYFARLCTRPTPFGLFSGITVGKTGEKTRLELSTRDRNRRVTRLDGEYLSALAARFAEEEAATLRFEPNSSLYRAAARLRFSASRKTDAGRSYDLVAIEPTPHLEAALLRAKGGATLAEIGAAASEASGVSPEEGTEFARLLVRRQVLVPLLEPLVTGEPLLGILEALEPGKRKPLEQVRASLRALDEGGLGAPTSRYRELARELEALGAPLELPRLFQVDMVKDGVVTLGPKVVSELEKAVTLAHRITHVRPDEELERWKQAFLERYELREVPLTEALDDESGVGFGATSASEPLLRGLALPVREGDGAAFTRRDAFLLEKLVERPRKHLELTEEDLKALEVTESERLPLPHAFSVVAALASRSQEALDQGDFALHLQAVMGPSGATLLGRFAHTDERLLEEIRAHLKAEESARPDALFAEVVHLPEGRLGNVIFRPVLRRFEIPFLGRSSAKETIPTGDLLVSVVENKVVLRSRTLGKEVVPRITCAFNLQHRTNQPLFRFLGALQQEGTAGALGFTWGALHETAPFLPRVTSGKLVLSLARWNVSARAFEGVKKAKKPDREKALRAFQEALSLPRFVALADMDSVLPVDFENPLLQDAFFQLVKERPSFALTELFPEPEELCLASKEGRFNHELVFPFTRRDTPPSSRETRPFDPSTSLRTGFAQDRPLPRGRRSFPPGSSCLFVKLYTGTGTADLVLRTLVEPLVRETKELHERWFFLRYQDPRPHIRLRFFGERASEILPLLHERARRPLEEGRIARIQLDTYERELERYGDEEGVSLAENVFQEDSECALALIAATPGDQGADQRWRLLVRGIDQLLSDLGLTLEEKRAFAKKEKEGYGRELGAQDPFWRQLGVRFRRERGSLERLLDRAHDKETPLLSAFEKRSQAISPLVPRIKELPLPLASLASSYVHMQANRLLRTAQRLQEACLHYFMERLYEGITARTRGSNK